MGVEERTALAQRVSGIWYQLGHDIRWISRSRAALVGSIIMSIFLFIALAGPALLSSHHYAEMNLSIWMLPPFWMEGGSWEYPLGTDELGRDTLSRIMYGARIAFIVAGVVVIVSASVGVLLGLMSGYFGGLIDTIIMRIVDIQWTFPAMLLAIAVMAILGTSLPNLLLVVAITQWVSYARTVRGVVLSLKEEDFVTASRSIGANSAHIIFRHILPNVMAPVLVLATFGVGRIVLMEASLSFLGLGVPPPTPSWGSMISLGRQHLFTAWWLVTLPGAALTLLVLGVNQLGDGLRDLLDPRLRDVL